MKSRIDNRIIEAVSQFDRTYDLKAEYGKIKPRLKRLLEANPSLPASLPLRRCLANICDVTGRWREGFSYVKTLDEVEAQEEILRTHHDASFLMRNLVRLYDVTGKLYYRRGYYRDAKSSFDKAEQMAKKEDYHSALLDLRSNLLRTRYNEWGLAKKEDTPELRRQFLEDLANEYQKEIEFFCTLDKREFDKLEWIEIRRGLSSIYHNYAIALWTDMSEYDDSFYDKGYEYHNLAEELNRDLEDNYRLTQTLMNKGLLYLTRWLKDNDKEWFLNKAEGFFDQVLDRRTYWPRAGLWVIQRRAEIAYKKGDKEEGRKFIRQVKDALDSEDEADLPTWWWTLSNIAYKYDKEEFRDELIETGMRVRNQFGFFHYRRDFYGTVAEARQERAWLNYEQGNFLAAIDDLNQAHNRELVDILRFQKKALPVLQKAEEENPNLFQEVETRLSELHEFLEVQPWLAENKASKQFPALVERKARRQSISEEIVEQEAGEHFNQIYLAYELIGERVDVDEEISQKRIDYATLCESDEAIILYYLSEPGSVAFIIKGGSTPIDVPLDDIDAYILEKLNDYNLDPEKSYDMSLGELQKMYNIMIEPFEKHLQGVKRLYFLPSPLVINPHNNEDGKEKKPETRLITNLPLHAAHDGEQFLLQRFEIATRLTLEAFPIKNSRITPEPRSRRMLIIGDPTEDLKDAAIESKRIATIAQKAGLEVEFLDAKTVPPADRQTVINLLAQRQRKFEYVHFSTHGLIHPDYPLVASVLLRKGSFMTTLDVIFKANFEGTEVVTLSTCNSGDTYSEGSENLGMARAFIAAGADAVIGGMGSVDASICKALFSRFYDILLTDSEKKEHDAITAWQQACLEQLKTLPTEGEKFEKFPAKWSPFVIYV